MPIGFIDRLKSNNPQGYGIVAAKEVAGHKTVAEVEDLYSIADPILSLSGNNTDNDAIGQLWYVISEQKHYKLVDWNSRGSAAGWAEFTTDVDLSDYATKGELASKANASTVSELQTKVNNKADASTVSTLQNSVNQNTEVINNLDTNKADKTYVDEMVASLVNGAPETLDTLDELAAALKDNADIVEVLNGAIANKADGSTVSTLQATVGRIEQNINDKAERSEVEAVDERVEGVENALAANNSVAGPTIIPRWSAFNQAGEAVTLETILQNNSDITNPQVEDGYKFKYAATYKWQETSGKRNPTAIASGSSFVGQGEITESGIESDEIVPNADTFITKEMTLTAALTAPEVGYKVSNSYLVPATGLITVKATARVLFLKKMFYGKTTASDITEAIVEGLTGIKYTNSVDLTVSNLSTANGEYYVYAFPKRLAEIKADGGTAWNVVVTGDQGFIETQVQITNAAGLTQTYYVYRTTQSGALSNTTLEFK